MKERRQISLPRVSHSRFQRRVGRLLGIEASIACATEPGDWCRAGDRRGEPRLSWQAILGAMGGEIVRGASIYCARRASCADAPLLIRQRVVASFNTTPVPWFLWKGAKCIKRCPHKHAQYIARPRFVANPHGRRAHTYFEARSKEAKISSPLHATEGEFSFIRALTRETYCTSYLLSRCTSR